jgi:hypothetical protein
MAIFFTAIAAGWMWWKVMRSRSSDRTLMLVIAIVLTTALVWMIQFQTTDHAPDAPSTSTDS